jgi:hypothetical protein
VSSPFALKEQKLVPLLPAAALLGLRQASEGCFLVQ